MTPTIGILYPGYSAEDDYPRAEAILGGPRLPLVHTEMREDAHRVDALLDIGGDDVLADGVKALGAPLDAVVWACTSGSFVFGWEGANAQVEALGAVAGVPASSTSFAFVDACARLGVTRVAVGATYPDDVARRFWSSPRPPTTPTRRPCCCPTPRCTRSACSTSWTPAWASRCSRRTR
jgi:Arylmalonate decarboxylase